LGNSKFCYPLPASPLSRGRGRIVSLSLLRERRKMVFLSLLGEALKLFPPLLKGRARVGFNRR